MKHRSTILGLVVLVLLVAGVFSARLRRSEPGDGAPGPGADVPDATRSEAVLTAADVRIRVAIQPNPPVAFAKMRVRIRAERDGLALPLDNGTLDFDMAMPMGEHRYTMTASPDGWYEATVTLPECVTGDRRWYGTIAGVVAGQERRGRFRIDLARLE